MTTITLPRALIEQALEVINDTAYGAPVFRQGVRDTITALRAALAQPDPQDAELSAALGWPGGISEPVLDRKTLLQMVAALMQDKLWEDHRVKHLWDHAQQAEPVQMHPSQFAELIKGKETMIGVPVYWSEWPTKETQ